MEKNAGLKCNAKKYIRFGPENTDAPGASLEEFREFFSKESS